jgi:hypothetical protein
MGVFSNAKRIEKIIENDFSSGFKEILGLWFVDE